MLLIALLGTAQAVPHHGAYTDPNHYKGGGSFAGMRFIAEMDDPPHILRMVGTDDGANWWFLTGRCSGEGMKNILFDFSPKGGPSDLHGTAVVQADGTAVIVWRDGNKWSQVEGFHVEAALAAAAGASSDVSSVLPFVVGLLAGAGVMWAVVGRRKSMAHGDQIA